jgi:plasmid stability protein
MTMMIELPDRVARRLKQRAQIQHRSLADVAIRLLEDALTEVDPDEDLVALVDRISSLPPNPHGVIPAQKPFTSDFLAQIASEPSMSPAELAQWEREWVLVEAEMARIEREDTEAEGRV